MQNIYNIKGVLKKNWKTWGAVAPLHTLGSTPDELGGTKKFALRDHYIKYKKKFGGQQKNDINLP